MRDPEGIEQALCERLVHGYRRRAGAAADVGHAGRLEQALEIFLELLLDLLVLHHPLDVRQLRLLFGDDLLNLDRQITVDLLRSL